jgi:hypothetical protein
LGLCARLEEIQNFKESAPDALVTQLIQVTDGYSSSENCCISIFFYQLMVKT